MTEPPARGVRRVASDAPFGLTLVNTLARGRYNPEFVILASPPSREGA